MATSWLRYKSETETAALDWGLAPAKVAVNGPDRLTPRSGGDTETTVFDAAAPSPRVAIESVALAMLGTLPISLTWVEMVWLPVFL
jgi:hypothetical protein